jgi:cobalt-zinc-cadmium efflux system membrane fusion protein
MLVELAGVRASAEPRIGGDSGPLARGIVILLAIAMVAACSRSGATSQDRDASPGKSAAGAAGRTADNGAGGETQTPKAGAHSAFFLTEDQRSRIHTVTIAPSVYRPTIVTTGTAAFNGDRSTPVLTQISGPVSEILVTNGTYVHPGTPLARVTSPDFAQAIASFQKAQTALHNATRIALLDEQLFKADAIARTDLEQARSDSASAWADREAAIQQMVAFGVDSATITAVRDGRPTPPAPGVIRAPIAGVIVERLINPGQVVQAGQTQAFTIADLSTMWVMANVFESNLADVSQGETAWITTDAFPDTLRGRVDYVAAIVDTATRATAVRVVVQNRHQILKRDMYVRVAIQSATPRRGILAPVSSVLRDEEDLPFVFLAESDGGFDRRSITLGSRVGDEYEVTQGLAAGDRVVSEGALFIQFAESQ